MLNYKLKHEASIELWHFDLCSLTNALTRTSPKMTHNEKRYY